MPDSKLLGGECRLYRNTGTWASPTWNEITNIEDLSIPRSKGQGEFRTRGNQHVRRKGGKLDQTLEFKLIYDPGDDDFSALNGSYENGTPIDVAAVDGPIATPGTQGLRFVGEVMDFPLDEPLEEGVSIQCVIAPTIADNDPAWMVVPTPP